MKRPLTRPSTMARPLVGRERPRARDPELTLAPFAARRHPDRMKPLIVAAILASVFLFDGCGRRYEDLLTTRPSPDGAIIAASNRNSGEFPFEAQYAEVRYIPVAAA